MKFRVLAEYEYPVAHKPPVKAELVLHGDTVTTSSIKPIEQEPEWILISDGLPKEHICDNGYVKPSDAVLITTKSGDVTVSRYWGNRYSSEETEELPPKYYDWVEAELWEDDVVAWMPFPKPYGSQENTEPCEDTISRKDILNLPRVMMKNYFGEEIGEVVYVKDIESLLSVTPKQKWISIDEKMPEGGMVVLFCDIDGDVMIGYHVKGRAGTHFTQCGTYEDMKNVKWWMPLPKPPLEVEEYKLEDK